MSVIVLAVVTTGTGVAAAAESTPVQTDADIASFGLLGPVGLVAVALGVIGMALGVLRQRRKTQAVAREEAEPARVEDPALAPYRHSA